MRPKSVDVYILITFVITMCLQLGCSPNTEPESAIPKPPKYPIDETLARADQLFAQREDVKKLEEARQMTAKLREPDNRNFEVEWRFSKYSLFLGQKTDDEEKRQKILEEGRDAGKIASRVQADRPEGYFWYGANLAALAKMSPVTVGYTSVDNIRDAMNTVIKIQPDYQGASAYDVLARIELNTHLFGGKSAKAVEYLEKGIELEKNNSSLQLHLAQAYLEEDKTDKAKEQLEYILKMQPDPNYVPEHKENVAEAKKLLASRF